MSPDTCHRRSLRLPLYDYSQDNAYFITICATKKRVLFGHIQDGNMMLSEAGQVVVEEWLKTARLRSYVKLDEFTVMPNHFHGILWLAKDQRGTARRATTMQRFGHSVSGSLPTIIRAFKSAVTNQINAIKGNPGNRIWQRNYYEHVIRDEESLNRIREYILNNSQTWESDRENPGGSGDNNFYRWLASLKSKPRKGISPKTQE